MTDKQRVELGRKYAYGIDQMVDIEGAFSMWCGVEHLLNDEDREAFGYISEIISERSMSAPACSYIENCVNIFNTFGGSYLDNTMTIANKKKHTEEELRALADEIIDFAIKNKKIDALCASLEAFMRNNSELKPRVEKVRKEENIRFGNNVGHVIAYYWTSIQNFLTSMNKERVKRGFEEKKSVQGIYNITSGNNGMDESGQLILVDMVNEKRRTKKGGLIRDITLQDFYTYTLSEFVQLFDPVKIDPVTEKRIKEEKVRLGLL